MLLVSAGVMIGTAPMTNLLLHCCNSPPPPKFSVYFLFLPCVRRARSSLFRVRHLRPSGGNESRSGSRLQLDRNRFLTGKDLRLLWNHTSDKLGQNGSLSFDSIILWKWHLDPHKSHKSLVVYMGDWLVWTFMILTADSPANPSRLNVHLESRKSGW